MKALLPDNEAQRLKTLRGYDVLDTPSEQAYDDLTLLAAQICQVPIAVITLIDENRQWFKSIIGLNVTETPRDIAFCAHAILYSDKVLEVRDAELDPRFADNPLVTADPHIRFYAGAPLVTPDGSALGTLCVLDYQPRELNEAQKYALQALSRHVVNLLELRRSLIEHKQTEATLRESEERFRDLFENAHDLIQSVRPDGSIIFVNRAWRETLGYSEAEVVGLSLRDIIHPSSLSHCMEMFQRVMTGDALSRIEAVFRAKDGREIVVDGTSSCRFIDGKPVATRSIFRDITGQKHAEQLLRARNEELKGFAYTVSHDLKAPLRGILGYAQELERRHKAGLSDRAQFCMAQIITAAKNLDNLIEDLLEYSRLDAETLTLTEVRLLDLIQSILHDRSHTLTKMGVVVSINVPPLALRTWERGLYQILTNLIDNAIKYSRNAKPPRLTISAEAVGSRCLVTVADNGIGFDMKYHDRIYGLFNRLVRADEFEGTGVGLAIVKKLIEKLGGSIRAEAALGQGATFFVELPSSSAPTSASPTFSAKELTP